MGGRERRRVWEGERGEGGRGGRRRRGEAESKGGGVMVEGVIGNVNGPQKWLLNLTFNLKTPTSYLEQVMSF